MSEDDHDDDGQNEKKKWQKIECWRECLPRIYDTDITKSTSFIRSDTKDTKFSVSVQKNSQSNQFRMPFIIKYSIAQFECHQYLPHQIFPSLRLSDSVRSALEQYALWKKTLIKLLNECKTTEKLRFMNILNNFHTKLPPYLCSASEHFIWSR